MLTTGPTYLTGQEVHVGDRVNHCGFDGTVVMVTARNEYADGFPKEAWQDQGNVLVKQDDGQLFMYDSLNDQEDVELLSRTTAG